MYVRPGTCQPYSMPVFMRSCEVSIVYVCALFYSDLFLMTSHIRVKPVLAEPQPAVLLSNREWQ